MSRCDICRALQKKLIPVNVFFRQYDILGKEIELGYLRDIYVGECHAVSYFVLENE
jgi:hypothetical protein